MCVFMGVCGYEGVFVCVWVWGVDVCMMCVCVGICVFSFCWKFCLVEVFEEGGFLVS